MGGQHKRKKRWIDSRATTSDIKRTQEFDVNRLALLPNFELGYSPVGVSLIDFVNVSSSIASAQTNAPQAPAQITGLTVIPVNTTQLNLAWTASAASNLLYYNVYRSTTSGSGFSLIAQPTSNSYSNTGLTSGTIYYYQISAVNNIDEGNLSSERYGGTYGSFDGIANYLTEPDTAALDLTTNFTVAAWIKTTKNHTDTPPETMIINKGGIGTDTAGENMNYGIYIISGNLARVSFETSAGVDSASTSVATVNDGNAHLIVGTYNGTSLILYKDNATAVSTATSATPETNAKPLVVGKNSRDDTRYFNGNIAEAQVWNRAWTSGEVSTFYTTNLSPSDIANRVYLQSPPPVPLPLLVWIPMDGNTQEIGAASLVRVGSISTGVSFGSPGKFGSGYGIFNPTGAEGDIATYTDEYAGAPFPPNVPFILDPNVGFTISFWIRPTSLSALADQRMIIAFDDTVSGNSNAVNFYIDPTAPTKIGAWLLINGLTSGHRVHQTTMSINTWYHVVVTYKLAVNVATDFKLYVDKVVDNGTNTPALNFSNSFDGIQIGDRNGAANTYYQGGIDEIRVWEGAATQTQVNNIFATNSP